MKIYKCILLMKNLHTVMKDRGYTTSVNANKVKKYIHINNIITIINKHFIKY